jgi:aspartyl-tRNA(Asn)/glutamyl-tRNA(Gln) amidotransferase subunit A
MDTPWSGDASSLVDAYRAGERSPVEEVQATLAAIEASDLNCFSYLDPERALDEAARADLSLPFGGVPVGVKELESVAGWPATEASLVYRDRIATSTTGVLDRLFGGGAIPVGLTTASEFGGLNVSVTKLNGVTHNPWRHGRTVGGSSGGSSSAVAGGLVTLATGGDGGGSLRIPAGYTGLVGFKGTYGRITRGPKAYFRPGTVVLGALARSVRDLARYYDVCAGTDVRDPSSLPSAGTWERDLGTHDLTGKTFAVLPSLGGAVTLEPGVEARVRESAAALAAATGMREVEIELDLPNLAAQWMMGNLATLLADLDERWPACADDLTAEVEVGLRLSQSLYNLNTAAVAEAQRIEANEVMARAFEQVDFVIAATNPGPAFSADAAMSNPQESFIDWMKSNGAAKVGLKGAMAAVRVLTAAFPKLPNAVLDQASLRFPDLVNMGALTIISNIYGNPAVSLPAGLVDGLPVGMQVLARHHQDDVLFDLSLAAERELDWPRMAPDALIGTSSAAQADITS